MGFLDRLVSDLLQDSTGLPVRRLVRMVGGKNLLMMGAGAVLAGGAATALGQSPSQSGQGGTIDSLQDGRGNCRPLLLGS